MAARPAWRTSALDTDREQERRAQAALDSTLPLTAPERIPNLCNNKHLTRRHFRLGLFTLGDGGMVGATSVLK